MMLLLILCLCVSASAAHDVRCVHQHCRYDGAVEFGRKIFIVEGHNVSFEFTNDLNKYINERFYLNCRGWAALDSTAMPQFTAELRVSFVKLINCPLPTNASLIAALRVLNVSFEPENNELELFIYDLPSEPTPTSQHLQSLQNLTWLGISSYAEPEPELTPGLLYGFSNLRAVHLSGVKYLPKELSNLPPTVEVFHRIDDFTKPLTQTISETLQALPGVRDLTLEHRPNHHNYWEFDYTLFKIEPLEKNQSASLERLRLLGWKEKKLQRLENCDNLRSLHLDEPQVDELPDRFVSACPRLEYLKIESAFHLYRYPAKLLEGATGLKHFITHFNNKIRYLPTGFLQGAPNLIELEILNSDIVTLSRENIAGPSLQTLSLGWNYLDNNVINAIVSQTSLTTLLLNNNDFDGNICKNQGGVWSLRNLSISVPRAVLSGEGESVVLRCSYDLEGAALYSIKWYRAETEFYRYVPREMPPILVFPLPGTLVDLTQSDHQQVRIMNMHRQLSGEYQCEVSADAPLFHTDIRSAPLTVVDPPFRAPQISISRSSYARGDTLRANCSVDDAYPAPNITWIMDEHKIAETVSWRNVDADFKERPAFSQIELSILEAEHYKMGLTYTSSNLHRAYQDHYVYREKEKEEEKEVLRYTVAPPPSGQFELTCVATIYDIYSRKSDPIYIKEDAPHPASVTGEDSSGSSPLHSLLLVVVCAYAALL